MMSLLIRRMSGRKPGGRRAGDLKVLLHEGRSAPDCREGLMKF
jgi:hypothetical protein